MSIATLPVRFREVGRIRLGVYDTEARHPSKLDTFRLTTPNRSAADRAAELWGGEVRPWQSAPTEGEQFEVTTDAKELQVLVPPQDVAEGQFYEAWSKGGLQRRCDGVRELSRGDGSPCICDEEGERVCEIVTHLLVILPQLPDAGVWRLTTRGYNAAVELPSTLRILMAAVGDDRAAAAVLGIELRTSVQAGETHHFAVPVLRLPVALQDLAGLDGGGRFALPSESAAVPDDVPALAPEAGPMPEGEEGAPAVDAGVSNPADTPAASGDPSSAAASTGDESAELPEGSPAPVPPSSGAAVDPAMAAPAPDPDDDKPATDEQWNRAARLYGSRGAVVKAAAKLLDRTVAMGDITRAEMVRVIEAKHK